MKSKNTILLIGAAIAGYLLFAGKGQGEGGTGGSLITPAYPDWFSGTAPATTAPATTAPATTAPTTTTSTDSSFQISNKILDAMKGIIQPATMVYGGSSPQSKKELSTIQTAGFSTTGLQSSYDPWTNTAYTFTPETAIVEKKIISMAGFNTEGLKGSFDPESGKITTFSGTGAVSYTQPAATKKESSTIPSALAGAALPIVSSQQGGATVYTQATKRASNNFGLGIGRTTRY